MLLRYKIFLIIVVFISTIILSGCGAPKEVSYSVTLEMWGTVDSSDAFSKIIAEYKKLNPNVKDIKYRKITQETYKSDLIDALAAGQGPDIFVIQNSWLPSFESKLEPAPEKLVSVASVKEDFLDIVSEDFVFNGKVYALPLSVDSLAIYYNKDIFNTAGILSPPATWEEFNKDVEILTKIDDTGKITQAGASIGTANNINRATDLLGIIMLQNGVNMVDERKERSIMSNSMPDAQGKVGNPGELALSYYTQFADVNSSLYTWNNEMHYSIDAFSEGNLAMMFNYSWHVETIKSKNSKLNFEIAPLPQISSTRPLNYANYSGFGVSKNKIVSIEGLDQVSANNARIFESWQFLKFLTMNNGGKMSICNAFSKTCTTSSISDPAKSYIEQTRKPAARKDLIEVQKNDPVLGSFVRGNIIAKSWYQKNPPEVEKIMTDMINYIVSGGMEVREALSLSTNRITESMK